MQGYHLSNCLWAAAQLQAVTPEVLTASVAMAKNLPSQLDDMHPQELSNCLWAIAKLYGADAMVLTAVPALADCMAQKAESMSSAQLSSCLWSAVTLQTEAPSVLVLVAAIVKIIDEKVHGMCPAELSNCFLGHDKIGGLAGFGFDSCPRACSSHSEDSRVHVFFPSGELFLGYGAATLRSARGLGSWSSHCSAHTERRGSHV